MAGEEPLASSGEARVHGNPSVLQAGLVLCQRLCSRPETFTSTKKQRSESAFKPLLDSLQRTGPWSCFLSLLLSPEAIFPIEFLERVGGRGRRGRRGSDTEKHDERDTWISCFLQVPRWGMGGGDQTPWSGIEPQTLHRRLTL